MKAFVRQRANRPCWRSRYSQWLINVRVSKMGGLIRSLEVISGSADASASA